MSAPWIHSLAALVPLLGSLMWVAPVLAKTSGTHQNTVRKEVIYSVGGDIREARITFMDSTGRVEHEIVHVPWKLKIMMPCKSKVSIAARNLSPSGNIIARIRIDGQEVKEVKGQGHLAGVFAESQTCP
ncbi:MAG: rane protein [Pseudomonadota bacterium]